MLLPGAMSVFNMIITRTFYEVTCRKELLEAAQVDGATDFTFFLRVALPLSKPIIAVNLLFYGIAQWNAWFNCADLPCRTRSCPAPAGAAGDPHAEPVNPATIGGGNLAELLRRQELFDKLKYALIVVAMIPPLIAYPFVQKHFVKGALIGSIK